MGLAGTDLTASVFNKNGFRCSMLKGMACEDITPLLRGSVYKLAASVARDIPVHPVGTLPSPAESRNEVSGDNGGSEEVEVTGFSAAAKQFYKAWGPQLHTLTYRGELSEVDLLAWKHRIEKYFETYSVTWPREKVSLAADLLEGEAAK